MLLDCFPPSKDKQDRCERCVTDCKVQNFEGQMDHSLLSKIICLCVPKCLNKPNQHSLTLYNKYHIYY